jgi:hypothetical protein
MNITDKLIPTLILSVRHYQTMSVLSLLPRFIANVSLDLGLDKTTHDDYGLLVKQLLSGSSTGADKNIRVSSRETLLVTVAVMHLAYSLDTGQDVAYILDVATELGIRTPKRKQVREIFYRLCRGLELNENHRHILIDSFEKNKTLQLDDLLLSSLSPTESLFYTYV